MILKRLGNKTKLAKDIIPYFPPHKIYIEPFFGAGGMFFCKPQALYSIVNDLDDDVYNLFQVVINNKSELIELFKITPLSESLFYYWVKNTETDPVKKALRFLYLSSFSYLGKNNTFRLLHSNCCYKQKLEKLILKTNDLLKKTVFRNVDFREFYKGINVSEKHIPISERFIYIDSPYVDTTNNYNTNKWVKKDFTDLLDITIETKIRFAASEFDNPFVISEATKRNLNIIYIKERRNLKNRRQEILITNYDQPLNKMLF